MKNFKDIKKQIEDEVIMEYIFQQLWDETYTQTKNRLNSGKNRYRIKNDVKRTLEQMSKFFDDVEDEAKIQVEIFGNEEFKEGVSAFFAKRKPNFQK